MRIDTLSPRRYSVQTYTDHPHIIWVATMRTSPQIGPRACGPRLALVTGPTDGPPITVRIIKFNAGIVRLEEHSGEPEPKAGCGVVKLECGRYLLVNLTVN